MKKVFAAVAMLACVLTARAGADPFLPSFEIWGSIAFGGLGSGFQKELGDTWLSPVPDSYSAFMPIVGLRGYLLGPLGIEASVGIFGKTMASAEGYESLDSYDYTLANLGPVLRFAFRTGVSSAFALVLGGGVNYCFFSISNDFDPYGYFQDTVSDVGWYGKAGLTWYLNRAVFLDGTFWYYYMNARFTGGHIMDGTYYLGAFSIGFGI